MTTDLRAAIEALPSMTNLGQWANRDKGVYVHRSAVLALLDTAPPAPLDVERLARAIHSDSAMGCPPGNCRSPSRHLAFAGRVAREYAEASDG